MIYPIIIWSNEPQRYKKSLFFGDYSVNTSFSPFWSRLRHQPWFSIRLSNQY